MKPEHSKALAKILSDEQLDEMIAQSRQLGKRIVVLENEKLRRAQALDAQIQASLELQRQENTEREVSQAIPELIELLRANLEQQISLQTTIRELIKRIERNRTSHSPNITRQPITWAVSQHRIEP